MGRPSSKPTAEKKRIVLAVLRNEITLAEAARRESVSQTSIANWRDLFLEAGGAAIEAGATIRPTSREQQLAAEIEQLTSALGEAHMELRLWRKGGALYPGGTSSNKRVSTPR
jgi:transposase